jgi:hypothetical protein
VDESVFARMDAAQLRQYLAFLLYHYRVADAFWFIRVAEHFGQSAAESLNEEVWEQAGRLGARAIVERLGVRQRGLEGFVAAQRLYPWCALLGYQFVVGPDEVTLRVPSCAVQRARLDRGLGEYRCKEMHRREFAAFAAQIDPRLQVECRFAPPDPHPEDCFCEWRFWLRPGGGEAAEAAG